MGTSLAQRAQGAKRPGATARASRRLTLACGNPRGAAAAAPTSITVIGSPSKTVTTLTPRNPALTVTALALKVQIGRAHV